MEKLIKIRLHILSPIHIGCDEVYEPTSFVINPEKKKLISFDPLAFIKSLSQEDRKKLNEISSKGNLSSIIELYRFIFSKRANISGNEIDVSEDVIERYLKVKDMPLNERQIKQELNKFVIPRTAFSPYTNLPYISGSSLKGSMRTGYLSILAFSGGNKNGLKEFFSGKEPSASIKNRTNAFELEKELLKGEFDKDPFRLLKVSDLHPKENVKTKIKYALNYRKNDFGSGRGIPQIFEVIEPNSTFEGTIEIQSAPKGSNIKEPLEKPLLFASVNRHYALIYNNEINIAKKMQFQMPQVNKLVNDIKNKTGKRPFLIRMGKHSGAEAVTIEGNRKITIRERGGHKRIENESTTIWLASERLKPKNMITLQSFGWGLIEIL